MNTPQNIKQVFAPLGARLYMFESLRYLYDFAEYESPVEWEDTMNTTYFDTLMLDIGRNVNVFQPDEVIAEATYYEKKNLLQKHDASSIKYSLGITQVHGTKPEKVILSFTPMQSQYVLSQPLHHSQKTIINNNKEVQLKLELYITQELIMTILGYGENVKVIAPKALRDKIKVQIEKMKNLY